jgi:hypothetical protein
MKKAFCAAVLAVALPAALFAYDNSPSAYQVFPECVWAQATGGGTWVPEVQITNHTASTIPIYAYYFYATGYRFEIPLTAGLEAYRTIKYTNILATLQSIDQLLFFTQNAAYKISAVIRISNGNFGKTFPGLAWVDSNTANVGRNMMIPNIMLSSSYRTFTGFWNGHWNGLDMTVRFYVIPYDWTYVGNYWDEAFSQWQFKVFNPFTKAGLTGTFTNHWLYIVPQTSGSSGDGTRGLFGFGSMANNASNDTYALIATQWQ